MTSSSVMRIAATIAAVLFLAPAAAAQTPALVAEWQQVVAPGKVFTIEMPGKPGYKLEQAKSGGGTAFGYHSYALDFGGVAFVVQSAAYPFDVDVKNPKANLQAALDASGKHLLTKKWDKITWMTYQGAQAAEATGLMAEKLEYRNRVILKGHQMYSLGFAGPPGTTRSIDAERFFTSLKLR